MTRSAFLAVAALAALSGCATSQTAPVEVSRFYRPELSAAAHAPVAIVAAPGNDGGSLEFQTYAAAVRQELARLGYTAGAAGTMIAAVDIQQQVFGTSERANAVSVGAGGSSGGRYSGGGFGLGVAFNLGGGPKEQVETRLAVTIRDQATGQSVWEGRARYVTAARSPAAQPEAIAAKMTRALFEGYPGKSGETILVP